MGGRLGASPAPLGYLLEGQTHCGLGKNLQPRWRVAGESGNSLMFEPPSVSLPLGQRLLHWHLDLQGILCPRHSCSCHRSPTPTAGWASQAGRHLFRQPPVLALAPATQPLSPASSLKLMQRFLFGAGDARSPPPPLFCRDHRSICCPMVGPLGSATREHHHKGPCWQLCLCGARLGPAAG